MARTNKSKRRKTKCKTKSKCRQRLNDKIKINIKEYKQGVFKSRKQAIAVSYSQTLKKYPYCKRILNRK